jgi:rRNA processing protein Gar1
MAAKMARESVGKVVNLTGKGCLIRAPRLVPVGTTLVDVRHQPVGRVVDVLGPVAAPYLLVAAPKGARSSWLDREVYLP